MSKHSKLSSTVDHRCECSDPGCPVHRGESGCVARASLLVYRIDMEDRTGTRMCLKCMADALESGVFTTERPRA